MPRTTKQTTAAPKTRIIQVNARALIPQPIAPPAVIEPFTGIFTERQVKLVKDTICQGATDDELTLFLMVCQRTQLDPFMRQIYSISRRVWDEPSKSWIEKRSIQTSIDGFRLVADRTRKYRGQTEMEWCDKSGLWTPFWIKEEMPIAARVGALRAGFDKPMWGVARFESYVQRTKEGITAMWRKMPEVLIGKCAEALALRKAFPMELSGIYTDDEMGQVENPESAQSETKKIEAEVVANGGTVTEIIAQQTEEMVRKDMASTSEETEKLLDVECHIGNAGGPWLGKKVGAMVPKVIRLLHDDWLVKLPAKPLNKDARLRDAVLARKAIMDADGTWPKDAPGTPATPPDAQTTAPDPKKGKEAAKNAKAEAPSEVPFDWRTVVIPMGAIKGKTLGELTLDHLIGCYVYGLPLLTMESEEERAFYRGVQEAVKEKDCVKETDQRRHELICLCLGEMGIKQLAPLNEKLVARGGKKIAAMDDAEVEDAMSNWDSFREGLKP